MLGFFRKAFGLSQQKTPARDANAKHDDSWLLRKIAVQVHQVFWADNIDKTQSLLNVGSYSAMFGRDPAALKQDPLDWMNAIHPEDRPKVEAALPGQKIGDFDVRYRVRMPDGSEKWVRDRAFLLHDDDGNPIVRAGVVEDVTAATAMERQLSQDQKMKAIGALTGGIAHDFNNMLAVVQGNLEMAMDDPAGVETPELLQTALAAVQRGAALTHRLLAYARQQPLQPDTIDPSSILASVGSLLSRSLGESVDFETVAGGGLWTCFADRNELETVLINLLINARDAIAPGGKITVEAFNARLDADYARSEIEVEPGPYVCFAVTDDGAGMSDEVLERAMDPFFTTKGVGQGTGLGLSMAYGFARQSGGNLKIYTEVGKGTTVRLYLPRSPDKTAKPRSARPEKPDHRALAGLRILLVEDDDGLRLSIARNLQSFGCQVSDAASADAALALARRDGPFDLLVSDVALGAGDSGPVLAAALQDIQPGLSVLYISGYTENAILHHGRIDEGVTLLQKPFSRNRLAEVMLQVIAQSEQ